MEAVLQVADEQTPVGMDWGGIWDHVRVRHWPPNSVSDIFVYPSQPHQVVWGAESVDLLVNISLLEPATASMTLMISLAHADPPRGNTTAGMSASGSIMIPKAAQSAQLKLGVTSPQLWSPDTPMLYVATACWGGSGCTRNTSVTFGIKHLTTNGSTMLLNGAALYIHGVGDDYTYMESEAPPLDKGLYRQRLLTFKRFGFNFVRLHSHFEANEYMAAAAEVGILLSPALPMGAKNGSSHCIRLDLAEPIYRRTWTSLILKYRNNPSLMDYSMGNEYYGMPGRPSFPFRDSFYDIAKRLDPHRLVIDTDGCCWNAEGCGTGGTCNRTTNDFMVQFMGYTDNLVDPAQFAGYDEAPPKPIISHEAGDFNAMLRCHNFE
jgi:beta-galactosidase/beta-glucuronidase